MTVEAWQDLREQMRQVQKLPKLREHFRKHRREFAALGVTNMQQMEALYLEHIQRTDLTYFTYVSTQPVTQYRQWVLAAMDNRLVALYNESRQRHWSFMRPQDFRGYLAGGRDWWVKVEEREGKVKVQRWRQP